MTTFDHSQYFIIIFILKYLHTLEKDIYIDTIFFINNVLFNDLTFNSKLVGILDETLNGYLKNVILITQNQ